MDADALRDWLWLVETPNLGSPAIRRLLAAFGSAQGVVAAGPGGWREVGGEAVAQALGQPRVDLAQRLRTTLDWLAADPGQRQLLTPADAGYPALLLHVSSPPWLLHAQGRLELLHAPSVAIVGSRQATPQGIEHARSFAAGLSAAGWTVVSGLALGIDGAAHEGALTGPGSTVAVVGTGLDRVYPKSHQGLARRIADQGVLLSEFALGTPPRPQNFPRRNRLIAGLSRGTLVVEASLPSGSLTTARLASDCGREVFAIPGSIHSAQSRGCHHLIKEGAALVESVQDILDGLASAGQTGVDWARPASAPEPAANPPTEDPPLLAAMGHDPVSLDALSARLGWSAEQLLTELLTLELEGRVMRLPGGLFQPRNGS